MIENGIVNLKTDSPDLYYFTKMVIQLFDLDLLVDLDDVYDQQVIPEELTIKTYYENLDIAKSNRIHYLKFSISKPLLAETDEQLKLMLSE